MKRVVFAFIALLITSFPGRAACPLNGGFETGNLDYWSLQDPTGTTASKVTAHHSGLYGCRLICPADQPQALLNSSAFPVQAGKTYLLCSFVKKGVNSPSGNYMVAMAWIDAQNNTIYHDNAWAGTNNPVSYTLHTGRFTAPPGTVKCVIMLGAATGTTFLFDDVELSELVLDNGILTVGMYPDIFGGAITYLSPSGQNRNLINTYDRGREVQQSYYAGEALSRTGQHPSYSPWPWNPIQVGDVYGNSSQVIEASITNNIIYTKTIPLLWDMNNEAAQCYLEQWTSLLGHMVQVRCKLTCFRNDSTWTQVIPHHQELPAVYLVADLANIYTYVDPSPWQQQPLTTITNPWTGPSWVYWTPTEKWSAAVDNTNWGVGVYNAGATLFIGGLYVGPSGSTSDPATCYLSPLCTESLGKTSVYEYEYDLMVGNLEQIRKLVYMKHFATDYDQDGDVDISDLLIFTSSWLSAASDPSYQNDCDIFLPKNGRIDLLDYEVFAGCWGAGAY